MNTEPTRPGETPGEEPTLIGAGLRPVEDRVRRALDAEARSITPTDRLGAILADAHASDESSWGSGSGLAGSRRHRWLVPAVAAAAAVLVAGTVWAVNRPSAPTPPVAGTPTAVATSTARATSPTSSGAPSSVPTQTAQTPTSPATTAVPPPATTTASVPVYYLGPVVAGSDQLRLFREFVSTSIPAPATGEGKALAALRLATAAPPEGSSYASAWSGVTVESVSIGPGAITVRLSSGTTSTDSLAAEQLGWTAQAAAGLARPVRFELADGGAEVSPGHPVSSVFTRPTDPMAVLDQVAPVWVDEPARGSAVSAGNRLTVKGVASTFEATVEWELLRDGQRVDRGFTTASAGAPDRGTYRFTTKASLTPGAYVVRVFASSAKDGSPIAEQLVPVTAR
ncbi:Gmad2 immunoglobulin-like domain-containing protein [Terracoccus sp. 273MFTsu3.1]|uniref:Gmad2 immunoglobulin-like domain-containing protein n=1 Tax=Terracoccus sp. 273MFTsu3.1 TaxID=1172188 RepID=UPI0003A6B3D9|nr:Gmad2 immunoglobulin-like domain-containing protein [Terracoccus sp. 273MFTsu3.1]